MTCKQTVNKEASSRAGTGQGKPCGHSAKRDLKNKRYPADGKAKAHHVHWAAQRLQGRVRAPQRLQWPAQDRLWKAARAIKVLLLGFCWLLGDPGGHELVGQPVAGLSPHSVTWMCFSHDLRALVASERERSAAGPHSCQNFGSGKIPFRESQNSPLL